MAADLKTPLWQVPLRNTRPKDQLSFYGSGWKIVFFNESEVAVEEGNTQEKMTESVSRTKPKKKQGKREEDLRGFR